MTNSYIVRGLAFLVLVGLLSVALLSCAPGSAIQSGQEAGAPLEVTPSSDDLDHLFPGLEGIPSDQLFDHFLGGELRMTDRDGTPFTVKMTPGTVDSVSTTSITVMPNGQTATQTFNVTPDTIVRGQPERGSVQAIVQGDKIVVITRDDSQDAIMIAKHGPMFHKRMMESMMID